MGKVVLLILSILVYFSFAFIGCSPSSYPSSNNGIEKVEGNWEPDGVRDGLVLCWESDSSFSLLYKEVVITCSSDTCFSYLPLDTLESVFIVEGGDTTEIGYWWLANWEEPLNKADMEINNKESQAFPN